MKSAEVYFRSWHVAWIDFTKHPLRTSLQCGLLLILLIALLFVIEIFADKIIYFLYQLISLLNFAPSQVIDGVFSQSPELLRYVTNEELFLQQYSALRTELFHFSFWIFCIWNIFGSVFFMLTLRPAKNKKFLMRFVFLTTLWMVLITALLYWYAGFFVNNLLKNSSPMNMIFGFVLVCIFYLVWNSFIYISEDKINIRKFAKRVSSSKVVIVFIVFLLSFLLYAFFLSHIIMSFFILGIIAGLIFLPLIVVSIDAYARSMPSF